jgi:hypothetical protein
MNCLLCGSNRVKGLDADASAQMKRCDRCGTYIVDQIAAISLNSVSSGVKGDLYLLSGLTRQATENGQEPIRISRELVGDERTFRSQIASLGSMPSSVEAKGDALLRYIARHSDYPGATVEFHADLDYPVAFCKNEEECSFYIEHLKHLALITYIPTLTGDGTVSVLDVQITPDGWKRMDSLKLSNIDSTQAFVAMSFAKEFDAVFADGIQPVQQATGFTMLRMDGKHFNGKICDQIILEIRRSRFLIAEVSGQNAGVYYEAGFAMGLGLPVIWCCKANEVTKCHFDTRQFNHILWDNHTHLKLQLTDRILATIVKQERK